MRTLLMCLCLALASAGCLYGTGQATTKTVYRHDNGIYPATETSITQTYSGTTASATMPLLIGGYDPMTGMPYGQAASGYGGQGGSPFCLQHPDRCASNVTLLLPQPNVLVTNGYGGMTHVAPGGSAQNVPGGATGSYGPPAAPSGPPVDIAELQDRLSAIEKQNAVIAPAVLDQMRISCQIFLADPQKLADKAQREQLVRSCTDTLAQQ